MPRQLRIYVGLTTLAAALVLLTGVDEWSTYASGWKLLLILGLVVLSAAGEHMSFQVHSGWATHAGTVPQMAAVLLLPPGLAALVAGLGTGIYVCHRRSAPAKAVFNTASVVLAAGTASLVVAQFGGPAVLSDVESWRGLVAATLA